MRDFIARFGLARIWINKVKKKNVESFVIKVDLSSEKSRKNPKDVHEYPAP